MSDRIEFTPLPTSEPSDDVRLDIPLASSSSSSSPPPPPPPPPQRRRRKITLSDRVEQVTDAAISGLGPVLIVVAFCLLSVTIFCYFTVFVPFHYPWQDGQGIFGNLGHVFHFIIGLYLVWGILGNYYYAVVTPPGSVLDGITRTGHDAIFQDVLLQMESNLPKPERAHHCSVCKRCVLKYDHHCPWIHNCVGHYNHRYFQMFLTYLPVSCVYFVVMGAGPFMLAADVAAGNNWPYWLDRAVVAFSIVLAVAIGLAVGGMGSWHWYLTLTAQTTLEQYNNSYIRKVCKKRGDTFTNMYDYGVFGNLQDFFNIGPRGPWYTAFLPLRIPPIGNGKRFEKSGRGFILDFGDDDDEDMV
ncbi:hypothetical protein BGW38_006196 [Lunasporangiospora selenospora]|uniref:Palmitoyltransferase n=1 Tax=Lunasporangiospora selenospora TaxID=979761 RepID=A0A9P6G183_9FUNG|nr:hypothetical protein BGW38_006196 [Lunasporangiospora selenospora]